MMTPEIIRDRGILGGKPIIRGTRISVSAVLSQLKNAHGSGKHVKEMYPQLTESQVDAVIDFAKENIDGKHKRG